VPEERKQGWLDAGDARIRRQEQGDEKAEQDANEGKAGSVSGSSLVRLHCHVRLPESAARTFPALASSTRIKISRLLNSFVQ
jgi:hypothetical protein